MATHFSVLAWRTPWTEEPGGLQSMGSPRVCTTEVTYHSPGKPKQGWLSPRHRSTLGAPLTRGCRMWGGASRSRGDSVTDRGSTSYLCHLSVFHDRTLRIKTIGNHKSISRSKNGARMSPSVD